MLTPYGTPRPCQGCEHWGGDIAGTDKANCTRHGLRVGSAEIGCVHWVRAIGADDQPFQPSRSIPSGWPEALFPDDMPD